MFSKCWVGGLCEESKNEIQPENKGVRPNKYERGRFLVEMPLKFTRTVYRTAICPQESANLLPEKFLTGYLSATGCPKKRLCFLASHVSVRSPQNDLFTVTVLQHAVHAHYIRICPYLPTSEATSPTANEELAIEIGPGYGSSRSNRLKIS